MADSLETAGSVPMICIAWLTGPQSIGNISLVGGSILNHLGSEVCPPATTLTFRFLFKGHTVPSSGFFSGTLNLIEVSCQPASLISAGHLSSR